MLAGTGLSPPSCDAKNLVEVLFAALAETSSKVQARASTFIISECDYFYLR
jgi:hypothetical protein